MKQVFTRPESLKDVSTHFCPGCHHGSVHRLVAEALDEFGIRSNTIGVASVGCSVFLYGYFDVDVIESPHGRAPAVATGAKRARPDRIVFTYQGDGDLAAIGMSEIIHAANRGEDITVIFVNNTTYGMTGGQMAPTTLPGPRRGGIFGASGPKQPEECSPGQEDDQDRISLSGREKRIFLHRGAVILSDQLGDDSS